MHRRKALLILNAISFITREGLESFWCLLTSVCIFPLHIQHHKYKQKKKRARFSCTYTSSVCLSLYCTCWATLEASARSLGGVRKAHCTISCELLVIYWYSKTCTYSRELSREFLLKRLYRTFLKFQFHWPKPVCNYYAHKSKNL